jgi:transcriptional regulator with XRE-family HTH domain
MGSGYLVNEFVRSQLKRLRLEKGLKLVEAASQSGLAVSSYACMESGFYKINLDNLFRILGALEADISDVWPVETLTSEAENSAAQQMRVQAFRFNEVVSLSRAEGAALFRVRENQCSVLFHQTLNDVLLERLVLQLEVGNPSVEGAWFKKQRLGSLFVLFLKVKKCPGYVGKLAEDYLTIWSQALQ